MFLYCPGKWHFYLRCLPFRPIHLLKIGRLHSVNWLSNCPKLMIRMNRWLKLQTIPTCWQEHKGQPHRAMTAPVFVGKQINLPKGHHLSCCASFSFLSLFRRKICQQPRSRQWTAVLPSHQHSAALTHTWWRRCALLRHSCLGTEDTTSSCMPIGLVLVSPTGACWTPAHRWMLLASTLCLRP